MSSPENTRQTNTETHAPPLFQPIAYPEGSYPEMFSPTGELRPHWQTLVEDFNRREKSSFALENERVKRMRHEDGATINPYDNLQEQTTAWALDLIPFPLSAVEWDEIETGLQQRATLLESILTDMYGPQELLKDGRIPAELVFNNPNFLHACHTVQPSGNRYLTFYAADIYRDSDGHFRVLQDYGANPAGIGYALENRIVLSRVFGDLYHNTQIRRLAPFFKEFHHALINRASLRKDDPRTVLFSPGPDNNLYFEHALLSRYLGYPLVEGQDLTVRDGKLFLKKLNGLEPVEAIFRHIDDLHSDPFALRRETSKGVAGLIQACREQNIDIVNPIGSGFINTPALQPFLSDLCQHILTDDLKLQSHPSRWCGNEEGLNYYMDNVNRAIISPAMECSPLGHSTELDTLVKSRPADFMVSAPLMPSSAPTWNDQGIINHYVKLRIFACATDNGFSVMPGGLAIVSNDVNTLITGNPERQQSKDIWVLSDEPVKPVSMIDSLSIIPEFKRSSDLPSRVADNLLWLGRYLERAEGQIRILRPVYQRLTSEDRPEDIPELPFLLDIVQTKDIIAGPSKPGTDGPIYFELFHHLHEALFRRDKTGSVIAILKRVQETARNVRDRLSVDSFRVINRLEDFSEMQANDPLDLLDKTLFTLSGFSGLAMESMTRGLGWRFMDMGRRIERAINQSALIRIAYPLICDSSPTRLQALLEASDSLMTYRSRYRSAFQLSPVLDLLIADESNPKSLAFQLTQLVEHIEQMPQQNERRFSRAEERIALKMLTKVRLLNISNVVCDKDHPEDNSLNEFLASIESLLEEFSQQVSAHYLSRIPATPHYSLISGYSNR